MIFKLNNTSPSWVQWNNSGRAVYVQPEKEEKWVHQGCTYHRLITLTCSPNLFSNVNSEKNPLWENTFSFWAWIKESIYSKVYSYKLSPLQFICSVGHRGQRRELCVYNDLCACLAHAQYTTYAYLHASTAKQTAWEWNGMKLWKIFIKAFDVRKPTTAHTVHKTNMSIK